MRAARLSSFAFVLAAALALSACGPKYGKRVPDKVVSNLPFETRIELLEAENELAIAIDRRDEAHNEILRTRDHLRRAKDRLKASEREVGQAKDPLSKEVAKLAVAEAEARFLYQRAFQEVNVRRLKIEELALRCAAARYEVARVGAAKKAKVAGSEKLDQPAFEAQVASCEQQVATRRAELGKTQGAKAAAAKALWEKQKTELAKKTFDARASPYVE
jgi:hypothetical protein